MHGTDPRLDDPPGFVGGTLDRVDHIRSNPALLAETFADPAARVLVLDGLEPVEVDGALVLEPIDGGAMVEDHVLLVMAVVLKGSGRVVVVLLVLPLAFQHPPDRRRRSRNCLSYGSFSPPPSGGEGRNVTETRCIVVVVAVLVHFLVELLGRWCSVNSRRCPAPPHHQRPHVLVPRPVGAYCVRIGSEGSTRWWQ